MASRDDEAMGGALMGPARTSPGRTPILTEHKTGART